MRNQTDSTNWRATAIFIEGIKLLRHFNISRDWEQLDIAKSRFNDAINIDPRYNAARYYLGITNELIGNHKEAVEEFEQLKRQTDPPDVELLYNLGLSYFHQYRPEAYRCALRYLEEVIKKTNESSVTNAETVESKKEGFRQITIRLLAKSILAQVHSHYSIPPVGVSEVEAQYHFEEAIKTAEETLEEFHGCKNRIERELATDIGCGLYNAIGHANLYYGKRSRNKATISRSISDFNKAIALDPDNYRVLSNLGSAYYYLSKLTTGRDADNQLDFADSTFRRVLQHKPNYDFAFTRLSQIALRRGDLNNAYYFVELAKQYASEMTDDYLNELTTNIDNENIR